MAEIRIDRVSKRYPDGTQPLNGVSLRVFDGEFFILVGPSGCGKSTLLNMIVGLESVSAGEIRVDGTLVNDLDPKDRNMAMVFQSYAIYPHMSVGENMAFPLRMAKLGRDEISRRVDRAAAILKLEKLLDRKPATLSGGQRQRVAMGRAIVREPKAFLLDEPLSNLDPTLRVQMRAEIARLQKRLGATMIYVTHDQTEALTLGDRVAVLNRGRIQQVGTPRDLYARPENLFVASFIGAPAMNFLPAAVQGSRITLPMTECELPEPFREKSQPLIVGIRAEHIQHAGSDQVRDDRNAEFEAKAEAVEWLGADTFVHFRVSASMSNFLAKLPEELENRVGNDGMITLTARIDPAIRVREGDHLPLRLDLERLHFFAADTGHRLAL